MGLEPEDAGLANKAVESEDLEGKGASGDADAEAEAQTAPSAQEDSPPTETDDATEGATGSDDEAHDAALRAQYDATHEVAAAGGDNPNPTPLGG